MSSMYPCAECISVSSLLAAYLLLLNSAVSSKTGSSQLETLKEEAPWEYYLPAEFSPVKGLLLIMEEGPRKASNP